MSMKYSYTDKDGNTIPLSQVNDEIKDFRKSLGPASQIDDVESMISLAGIYILMRTGGFELSEQQIQDVCKECKIDKNDEETFIEFFVRRYTFNAWR